MSICSSREVNEDALPHNSTFNEYKIEKFLLLSRLLRSMFEMSLKNCWNSERESFNDAWVCFKKNLNSNADNDGFASINTFHCFTAR